MESSAKLKLFFQNIMRNHFIKLLTYVLKTIYDIKTTLALGHSPYKSKHRKEHKIQHSGNVLGCYEDSPIFTSWKPWKIYHSKKLNLLKTLLWSIKSYQNVTLGLINIVKLSSIIPNFQCIKNISSSLLYSKHHFDIEGSILLISESVDFRQIIEHTIK